MKVMLGALGGAVALAAAQFGIEHSSLNHHNLIEPQLSVAANATRTIYTVCPDINACEQETLFQAVRDADTGPVRYAGVVRVENGHLYFDFGQGCTFESISAENGVSVSYRCPSQGDFFGLTDLTGAQLIAPTRSNQLPPVQVMPHA
ncbi:MAG: hypothetical protein AB7G06_06030 [Bdellovibrionales bacterium]